MLSISCTKNCLVNTQACIQKSHKDGSPSPQFVLVCLQQQVIFIRSFRCNTFGPPMLLYILIYVLIRSPDGTDAKKRYQEIIKKENKHFAVRIVPAPVWLPTTSHFSLKGARKCPISYFKEIAYSFCTELIDLQEPLQERKQNKQNKKASKQISIHSGCILNCCFLIPMCLAASKNNTFEDGGN